MSVCRFLTSACMAIVMANCNTPTVASSSLPGESKSADTLPVVAINTRNGQNYEFKVELAISDREHARGLMNRDSLPQDQGMLFIFDNDGPRTFWMKNTLIPLDMLFISSQGEILGIVENAAPLTLTGRSISQPSRYVLELNGGLCKQLGIKSGDIIKIPTIAHE